MVSSASDQDALPTPKNSQSLDERLQVLDDHKNEWARLPVTEKIDLAKGLLEKTVAVGERQVAASVQAKSIPPKSALVGEEWLGGPAVTARTIRLLIKSLEDIAKTGRPRLPRGAVKTRDDGRTVVDVFPVSIWDRLLFQGFSAQIWMRDSITPENLEDNMASFFQQPEPEGRVALVLGAGNVASIGPLDVVYKLFVEGQVCILKMNPVNDYLGTFIEEIFAEFIERGFMEMAYGGAAVGNYLCHHDQVDEIHITGSDATHDAIVYGVGKEGQQRKQDDEPVLDKRITSELGNISPIIIAPGNWSDGDLRFHAENVATQLANNGGFNCNAARVLITASDWEQREQFLAVLGEVLAEIKQRQAYYPGAEERYDEFVNSCDDARSFGPDKEGALPWTVITDVDPNDEDNICFTTESFCGVMCETNLDAQDPGDFLRRAAEFCNDRLWGTLSASIIIDPDTEKSRAKDLDEAIAALEYGSIVINHWPALSYGLGSTSWGAYPGHTYDDIQSGIGVVHNTFLFDHPLKSVVRGPFRVYPKPAWFVTNNNTNRIGRKLTQFEENPGFVRFIGVLKEAIKG